MPHRGISKLLLKAMSVVQSENGSAWLGGGPAECAYMINSALRGPDPQGEPEQELKAEYTAAIRAWYWNQAIADYFDAPAIAADNIVNTLTNLQRIKAELNRRLVGITGVSTVERETLETRRHYVQHLIGAILAIGWLTGWGREDEAFAREVTGAYGFQSGFNWELPELTQMPPLVKPEDNPIPEDDVTQD